MNELMTGVALGFGAYYVIIQFGAAEVVRYKKFIDLAIFLGLMAIVFEVGSNFVVAITTWAGITASMLLYFTGLFVKPKP